MDCRRCTAFMGIANIKGNAQHVMHLFKAQRGGYPSILLHAMYPHFYPAFPIVAFLGFLAVLLPLTWISVSNTGIILYSLWVSIACLNQFINSVIWHNNALNSAPVWCDISTRLIVGISVAIPASSLCIVRRLYHICSMNYFLPDSRQKRRALAEDLAIGLGIPILQMAIQFIVEGRRYDVFEDLGCYPHVYGTWLAYVLSFSWPVIIGLAGALYSVLTMRVCYRKRKEMKRIFSQADREGPQYVRVFILACCEISFSTPLALFVMITNLRQVVPPYRGWEDTHADYSLITQFPSILWHSSDGAWLFEVPRWSVILCAVLFFVIFGFSGEARAAYSKWFTVIIRFTRIRRQTTRWPKPGDTLRTDDKSRHHRSNPSDLEMKFNGTRSCSPVHSTFQEDRSEEPGIIEVRFAHDDSKHTSWASHDAV